MKKTFLAKLAAIALVSISAISVVVASLAWFAVRGSTDNETLDGEVGLRSYFLTGTGTVSNPYVIASPTHMYNLYRLQNLGVFTEKNYFQVGYKFDGTNYQCVDTSSGTPVYTDWLDMTGTTIAPIGNENTPFVGEFNGNGLPIKNLTVEGTPDDIGFFGYIGYEGKVEGLILDTCEIKSVGYTKNTSDNNYQLYYPDVDHLFALGAHRFAAESNVIFHDLNASSSVALKSENGLSGVGVNNINTPARTVDTYFYNGYFEIQTPTSLGDSDPFTYEWRSSSPVIKEATKLDITTDPEETEPTLDPAVMIDLKPLADSVTTESGPGFNGGSDYTYNVRLSLYATYKNAQQIEFSRVIQSYVVSFHSNEAESYTDENNHYSMTIYCDYIYLGDSDKPNNYHHGNNIGFLAGHLDGTMNNSYVYNCHMTFTGETSSNYTIPTESDQGLIGEVGTNVIDALDPDYGVVPNAEFGIINFTKIYYGIRDDFSVGDVAKAGHIDSPAANYITYNTKKNTSGITKDGITYSSLFDSYEDYLRTTETNPNYFLTPTGKTISSDSSDLEPGDDATAWHNYTLTSADIANADGNYRFNSVDFLRNKVIQDEDRNPRGLGVFKLVTYSSGESNPYNAMGSSIIINGNPKETVYFSTAEYDHTKSDNFSGAWGDTHPFRPTSIPEYSDSKSFEYPFSRDYNYNFELNLTDMDNCPAGHHYMAKNNSEFLTNYLMSKLHKKDGDHLSANSPKLGFNFRSSLSDKLYSLSSYMPLGKPQDKRSDGAGNYYPSNSIVFRIDNENGANVSVVGNNADISVYTYKPNENNNNNTKALYTMRARNSNTTDFHRYFTFQYNGLGVGEVGTEVHNYVGDDYLHDNQALYGHIFYLPQGDYVLGASPDSTAKANLYFLAVQGQKNGDIDSETQVDMGQKVSDIGFLTTAPTVAKYLAGTLDIAAVEFSMNCNGNQGTLYATPYEDPTTHDPVLLIEFSDSPSYVTYLHTKTNEESPHFYVNYDLIDKQHNTYRNITS